jgi:hypothetical protein
LGRVGSVVFRGFRGTLRVIFRLKESNTGLDRYYSRLNALIYKKSIDSVNITAVLGDTS